MKEKKSNLRYLLVGCSRNYVVEKQFLQVCKVSIAEELDNFEIPGGVSCLFSRTEFLIESEERSAGRCESRSGFRYRVCVCVCVCVCVLLTECKRQFHGGSVSILPL